MADAGSDETTRLEAGAAGKDMTSGLESVPHSLRLRSILEQINSPLLRLPGGLRNRIYSHALLIEGYSVRYEPVSGYSLLDQLPLRKSYFFGFLSWNHEDDEDFNQLKFVCRQLYTETACLELMFNIVIFRGWIDTKEHTQSAARLFTEFLKECAPSKASWLSRVELELDGDKDSPFEPSEVPLESSATLEIVADFCRMHPRCNVRYIIKEFNADSNVKDFLIRGYFITLTLRHRDVQYLLPEAHPFKFGAADGCATSRCVKSLDVPNFRVFPHEESCIDEWFLEQLGEISGMTDAKIKASFKLAEDWLNKGI